jgi:protein-tyrosine-phosphatase
VCEANICRSPAFEFVLTTGLRQLDGPSDWRVASAGTRTVEGRPMCPYAARRIRAQQGGADFASSHRSRRISPRLLGSAGLVLVSTEQQRAAITRSHPAARAYTFTMVEAAGLAGLACGDGAVLGAAGVAGLAPLLHRYRGRLAPPTSRRTTRQLFAQLFTPGQAPGEGPFDIADAHTGRRTSHDQVLDHVTRTADELLGALDVLTSRRTD